MTKYELANQVDDRVYSIFENRTKDCDEAKLLKIMDKITILHNSGKKLERAMADTLQEFKLA